MMPDSGKLLIEKWRKRGKICRVLTHDVFVYQSGNAKPHLLILHGYPTSSFDFVGVLPILEDHFNVVIHDHLGFGFSDKPIDYSYSLFDQTAVALELWQQLGIEEGHLVAHDYGTSVATELIAQKNQGMEKIKFSSLTLCNGSVHIEFADLRIVQRLLSNSIIGPWVATLSSQFVFNINMKRLWGDSSSLDQSELDAMWILLTLNGGRSVLPKLTGYLHERRKYWDRWIGALRESDLKTLILWGDKDPVAVSKIADALKEDMPHADLVWIPEVGHYPMMEAPKLWAKSVIEFLRVES